MDGREDKEVGRIKKILKERHKRKKVEESRKGEIRKDFEVRLAAEKQRERQKGK